MYISPFVCGILATILVEIGLCILYGIIKGIKENKNGKSKK